MNKSDYLVLVSFDAISKAAKLKNFLGNDWSLAWVNTIQQEVGPVDICDIFFFNEAALVQHEVVIITKSAIPFFEHYQLSMLDNFVNNGGVLVLEQPEEFLKPLSGVELSLEKNNCNKITWINAEYFHKEEAGILEKMPLNTLVRRTISLSDDTKTVASIDTIPAIFVRTSGKGRVISLAFDYGLQLVSIQQGVPKKNNFVLGKTFGLLDNVVEPEDMLIDSKMMNSRYPLADIFERFIMRIIARDSLLPGWWYFPGQHQGALIISHDEEGIGLSGEVKSLFDFHISKGTAGTFFLISDSRIQERWNQKNEFIPKIRDAGFEIGIHWNRFSNYLNRVFRHLKIKFPTPFAEQLKYLRLVFKYNNVCVNRTHYLDVGARYAQYFEELENNGISIDSTYGPNKGGGGYLFGTGYPFHPLGINGRLFSLLEMPFHIQEDWGGGGPEFIEILLNESREKYHQLLIINFHPHYKILTEQRKILEDIIDSTRQKGLLITSFCNFGLFLAKRNQSRIKTVKTLYGFRALVSPEDNNLSFAVPAYSANLGKLKDVYIDNIRVDYQVINNCGADFAIVKVEKGRHEINVYYGDNKDSGQNSLPDYGDQKKTATSLLGDIFIKIRKVFYNTLSVISGEVFSRILNFIASLILARYLGVSLFGEFNFLFSYLSFFEVFAQFGMNSIIVREITKNEEKAGLILGNALIIKVLMSFVALMLSCVIAFFLGYRLNSLHLIWFASLSLFLTLRTVFDAVLRVRLKMEFNLAANLIKASSYLGLIYLVVILKGFLFQAVVASMVSGLLGFMMVTLFAVRFIRPQFRFDYKISKELFTQSLPLVCSGFLTILYIRIDTVMLSKMKSFADIGYYTAATRLTENIYILPTALMTPLFPVLAEYYQKFRGAFVKIYRLSLVYLIAAIFPVCIAVGVFSKLIIYSLYGQKYLPSSVVLAIMIWSGLFGYISIVLVNMLLILRKQKVDLIVSALMVCLNIFLNYLLIPLYSYNGAGIATVATEFLGCVIWAAYLYKVFKLPFPLEEFKGLLLSIGVFLCLISLGGKLSMPVWAILLGSFSAYLGCLYLFKIIKKEEIMIVVGALTKKG